LTHVIPAPRPGAPATPATRESAGDASRPTRELGSIRSMMFVADLDRSLSFYTEKVGFTVVNATATAATLGYDGARILLQYKENFARVENRPVLLQIRVPDIDVAYRDLLAKGIEFRHRPMEISRSEHEVTLSAAFDDPDGHGLAITEYRPRHP
jgi:catechol 2,3-dioxygenase-like lactoylglutathione lyase family enzyme